MPGPDFDKPAPITAVSEPDWFDKAIAERKANGDWRWGTTAYFGTFATPEATPEPTFEERRQRCEAMGLILCSCTGVDRGGEHVMIISLACPIHGVKRGR